MASTQTQNTPASRKFPLPLISLSFLPNGATEINPSFHVPVPGRVQYYRAEALPFIPAEVKCQVKFPKAYAMSEINLRYLDKIRIETAKFVEAKINHNYFTGE